MSAEEPIADITDEQTAEYITTPKTCSELVIVNKDVPEEGMPVYVMVPKIYSEQVIVNPGGPINETTVSSKCVYRGSQNYKISVEYTPRIEPVHHVNTVVADGDEVKYADYVYFAIRMKPKSFSESVYSHPKRLETKYRTTFTHCDNYINKWYTTEVDVAPAMRLAQSIMPDEEWADEICDRDASKVEMLNGIDSEVPEL